MSRADLGQLKQSRQGTGPLVVEHDFTGLTAPGSHVLIVSAVKTAPHLGDPRQRRLPAGRGPG